MDGTTLRLVCGSLVLVFGWAGNGPRRTPAGGTRRRRRLGLWGDAPVGFCFHCRHDTRRNRTTAGELERGGTLVLLWRGAVESHVRRKRRQFVRALGGIEGPSRLRCMSAAPLETAAGRATEFRRRVDGAGEIRNGSGLDGQEGRGRRLAAADRGPGADRRLVVSDDVSLPDH